MNQRDSNSRHISGIIPVANHAVDIDVVCPPSLLPIDNGFTLVQRSILECVYAGCKTIWIVCSEAEGPLIKKVCGEFVEDLRSLEGMKFKKYPSENIRYIPIFYVPISYRNSEKRGIGVSVVEGIVSSFAVSSKISNWLAPSNYYVSSPYCVYDPKIANDARSLMSPDKTVILQNNKDSILTGHHLGFSVGSENFKHCNYIFKRMSNKEHYSLDKIFNNDIIVKNFESLKVRECFHINAWKDYSNILARGLGFEIYSTWKNIFKK